MEQLTIRGLDKELTRRLRGIARRARLSLNKAALMLMRRGAGLEPVPRPATIGCALDEFIGRWSREDERQFLSSIAVLEAVDESLWR